jgi:predicted nucleic acid-binding protein
VRYLIDTGISVLFLKGEQQAVETLTSVATLGLALSVISYGEIQEVLRWGGDPAGNREGFRRFLRGVRILDVTRRVANQLAVVRGDLRQRSLIFGDADILIAATALEHDLILIRRNTRHFERVRRLRLYR